KNFTGGENFFKQLVDAGVGDKAFIQEIVTMFMEESEQTMNELSNNIANKNLAGIKMNAHKLKSSFNMFELKGILELIKKLEALTENNISEADKIFPDLLTQSNSTFKIIKLKYL